MKIKNDMEIKYNIKKKILGDDKHILKYYIRKNACDKDI